MKPSVLVDFLVGSKLKTNPFYCKLLDHQVDINHIWWWSILVGIYSKGDIRGDNYLVLMEVKAGYTRNVKAIYVAW